MSRSCSNGSGSWLDHLPFVLLGMRTSIRADSQCSAADLLYGAPLRLPGDMFEPSDPVPLASDFSRCLRTVIGAASPMPVVSHGLPPARVDPALQSSTHVFLRVDAVRRPLVPPFLGPFPVLARTDKTYDILQNGKTVTVSIDRLKPATLTSPVQSSSSSPVPSATSPSSSEPVPLASASSSPPDTSPSPRSSSPVVLSSGRVSRPVRHFQA